MEDLLIYVENNISTITLMFSMHLLFASWIITRHELAYKRVEKLYHEHTIVLGEMIVQQSMYIEDLKISIDKSIDNLQETTNNINQDPFGHGAYGYFEWGETRKPDEPTKDIRLQLVDNPPGDSDDTEE